MWKGVFKLLNSSIVCGKMMEEILKKKTKDNVFTWELTKEVRAKAVDYGIYVTISTPEMDFDNCPIWKRHVRVSKTNTLDAL